MTLDWTTRRTPFGHLVTVWHNGKKALTRCVPTYSEAKKIGETTVENIRKELTR